MCPRRLDVSPRNLFGRVMLLLLAGWLTGSFRVSGRSAQPLISVTQANAADSSNVLELPAVQYQWVDSTGRVIPSLWKNQSQWTWRKKSQIRDGGPESPVLRTWFELPHGNKLISFHSNELKTFRETSESPFPRSVVNEVFAIDTDRSFSKGVAWVELANGSKTQLTLIVRVKNHRPFLWTHPNCRALGFELSTEDRLPEGTLYLSAYCRTSLNQVEVVVGASSDLTISEVRSHVTREIIPSVFVSDIQGGRYFKQSLSQADLGRAPAGILASIGVIADGGTESPVRGTESSLSSPKPLGTVNLRLAKTHVRTKRTNGFYLGLGTNISYLSYLEDANTEGEFGVTQTALTLKGSTGYRLSEGRWDLGITGFANVTTVSAAYQGDGDITGDLRVPSRFFGFSGRVSRSLAKEGSPWDLRLAAGPYLWGMIVPSSLYGVKFLFGPQIFISMRNLQNQGRSWGTYFKYALTGSVSAFNISNAELAIGGDFPLTRLDRYPVSATLDIARVSFSSPTQSKSMSLLSASIGVQSSF